jgi:CubicO group peptidase (beta-lactamase class C family)
MSFRPVFLVACAACSASSSVNDGSNNDAGVVAVPTCRTDVAAALGAMHVPGVAAGIIKHGQLACTATAGMADIAAARAVTPDTVFAWASVSKTVTATALMILYDEGKFGLDDNIDAYLPFPVAIPACSTGHVTFRQLLTHTSSIVDSPAYDASYDATGDSSIALGDFLRSYLVPGGTRYRTQNFVAGCPGTASRYSNVGAGLIGYLVEEISKTPFDRFARERIFEPLGMDESSYRLADLDVAHVAMPYDGASQATFVAHGHNGFPTYPDGLVRSSLPHLARFLAMFSQYGAYGQTRILTEATANEMRRRQVPTLDGVQAAIWFYANYGARKNLLGHDGDDPGTSSLMFFDPADGSGVLLVANGSWADDNDEQPAADALFGKLFDEAATL